LASDPGYFTWYELMTTDAVAAAAFYRDVVGWGTQEASTPRVPYTLFTAGEAPAAGLMELPEESRRMGATPRWMGYVGIRDVHATVDRVRRLGGAVFVPPTETNIGLISVVADPFAASFALIDQARIRPQHATESGKKGRVGWVELLAADLVKEFVFYRELFGWREVDSELDATAGYQAFSAGGQVIGGALKKRAEEPVPYWLFYFNVEDLDAALERVKAGGGRAFLNDVELPGGLWFAHCVDPQGAAFALRGKEGRTRKLGWSAEWRGFSSHGQLVGR
jgi:predicted enzyme related to lactoylglutathione lyase